MLLFMLLLVLLLAGVYAYKVYRTNASQRAREKRRHQFHDRVWQGDGFNLNQAPAPCDARRPATHFRNGMPASHRMVVVYNTEVATRNTIQRAKDVNDEY